MKIVYLNVGLPRLVLRNGEPVSTGIFKELVGGRVMLRALNLDGDRQADLSVHGGAEKAVYVYPSEHFAYQFVVNGARFLHMRVASEYGRAPAARWRSFD